MALPLPYTYSRGLHMQIAVMTLEEAVGTWQDYIAQLSALLRSLKEPRAMTSAHRAASERLSQLTSEACVFMMRFALVNPVTSKVR